MCGIASMITTTRFGMWRAVLTEHMVSRGGEREGGREKAAARSQGSSTDRLGDSESERKDSEQDMEPRQGKETSLQRTW
eukprot:2487154-Rhodomonas_salina.1